MPWPRRERRIRWRTSRTVEDGCRSWRALRPWIDGAPRQAMKQQEGSRRVELGEPAAVEDAPVPRPSSRSRKASARAAMFERRHRRSGTAVRTFSTASCMRSACPFVDRHSRDRLPSVPWTRRQPPARLEVSGGLRDSEDEPQAIGSIVLFGNSSGVDAPHDCREHARRAVGPRRSGSGRVAKGRATRIPRPLESAALMTAGGAVSRPASRRAELSTDQLRGLRGRVGRRRTPSRHMRIFRHVIRRYWRLPHRRQTDVALCTLGSRRAPRPKNMETQ